jgi:hypothetical protein
MEYLQLVPKYVKALKTAQYQAAIAFYKQNAKKNLDKVKPLDLGDEEEEPKEEEKKPPNKKEEPYEIP